MVESKQMPVIGAQRGTNKSKLFARAAALLTLHVIATKAGRCHATTATVNVCQSDIPYLELAEPEEGYHGLIKENETLVEVTPAIRARGPLCSFLILNNKHHGEAPFERTQSGKRNIIRNDVECHFQRT
ncbi:hypothetical protein SFRURICE_001963 [Spodoptera frugiperda]|nr:hypothetical protein SFRURICE_001963 [Spodoptera frugiperda]